MEQSIISSISPTPTPDPILQVLTSINHTLNSPWYIDPQWWAIATALLLGVFGIFQDRIRGLFQKPKLEAGIRLSPPDCHKIALKNTINGQFICDCYYFRFNVKNSGNTQMDEVEVMANELYRKGTTGRYSKIANFLPINLKWAHNGVVTMPKIQPKLFKHCDFGHIIETSSILGKQYLNAYGLNTNAKVVMILDTFIEPNTGSHLLLPGEYKINIIFAANNIDPISNWYKIKIVDAWDGIEQNMLSNNVFISKI